MLLLAVLKIAPNILVCESGYVKGARHNNPYKINAKYPVIFFRSNCSEI